MMKLWYIKVLTIIIPNIMYANIENTENITNTENTACLKDGIIIKIKFKNSII